jgi:hypothetical protein
MCARYANAENIIHIDASCWEVEVENLPVLEIDDISKIHTKILLKMKPNGVRYMGNDKFFVAVYNNLRYAINVGDILSVLSKKPHIPNKKESKKIRQLKAKNKYVTR